MTGARASMFREGATLCTEIRTRAGVAYQRGFEQVVVDGGRLVTSAWRCGRANSAAARRWWGARLSGTGSASPCPTPGQLLRVVEHKCIHWKHTNARSSASGRHGELPGRAYEERAPTWYPRSGAAVESTTFPGECP